MLVVNELWNVNSLSADKMALQKTWDFRPKRPEMETQFHHLLGISLSFLICQVDQLHPLCQVVVWVNNLAYVELAYEGTL